MVDLMQRVGSTFPDTMRHKLKDEVPGAQLVELAGCGYALPTERPDEVAGLIRDCAAAKPVPVIKAKERHFSRLALRCSVAVAFIILIDRVQNFSICLA